MENKPEKFHIRNEANIPWEIKGKIRTQLQEFSESMFNSASENAVHFTRGSNSAIDEALGEGATEKLVVTYRIIRRMFNERGVPKVDLTEVLLSAPTTEDSNSSGQSFTHVEISDVKIHDINLRQLSTLKTLVHELYHAAGKSAVDVVPKKYGPGHYPDLYASGAGYDEAIGASALEEGAAVIFENEAFEQLKQLFPPEAVTEYEHFIKLGKQEAEVNEPDIYEGTIILRELDENKENFQPFKNGYSSSFRLVSYLRSQIPDFDTILEKLRVNRQPLDLAREMEKRFGKEMYRKLVTCKVVNAQSLLEELQSKELPA